MRRITVDREHTGAKNKIRRTKSEILSNDKIGNFYKQSRFGFAVLDFLGLGFISEFVSDFDIRIWDLFRWYLGATTFSVASSGGTGARRKLCRRRTPGTGRLEDFFCSSRLT